MKLSENGITSWGARYEWVLGGSVILYHDATDARVRLETHLNTRAGLPSVNDYHDDTPCLLTWDEKFEWYDLCGEFQDREREIYARIQTTLMEFAEEQVKDMRLKNPSNRIITDSNYNVLSQDARNAVASALGISVDELDLLPHEEGRTLINLWLSDAFEAQGYELEPEQD